MPDPTAEAKSRAHLPGEESVAPGCSLREGQSVEALLISNERISYTGKQGQALAAAASEQI